MVWLSSRPRLILGAGALLWLGAIVAAPLAAARGSSLAAPIYLFFHQICHQQAGRSFALDGHQLAVCHRCTGLYLGFLVGLVVTYVVPTLDQWIRERPIRITWFLVPMLVDVALFPFNTWQTRFATGLIATLTLSTLVVAAVRQVLQKRGPATPLMEPEETT